MASIIKESDGRKTIQFTDPRDRRKRPKVRLGKATMRQAEFVKNKIEQLIAAKITKSTLETETARWISGLDDELSDRLAALRLIPRRAQATLEAFLDEYFAKRTDVKSSTKTNWRHTRRNLIEFFGVDRPLRDITPGDAKDWERYLKTEARDERRKAEAPGLSADTVRKRCANAKQFFNDALEHELIDRNPFSNLRSAVRGNRSRDFFVKAEVAAQVIDACPDAEWRLLFALSRFGGLRCPSEHLALQWSDVDWQGSRITVRSPKTEHHPGRQFRVIPIFPELRPHLEAVREEAEPGTSHVITRYRNTNANLRTQLTKIIRRAGIEPWPKLFQNLRASRQTELEEHFPSHVVNTWIGNTRVIAEKHYLQVTDDHFRRGAGSAVQKAVQQDADSSGDVTKRTDEQSPQVASATWNCSSKRHFTTDEKWAARDSNL